MLTLNLSPLSSLGYDLTIYQDLLPEYLQSIAERNQGFYSVIDDDTVLAEIEEFANSVVGKYDDIVVLGIGGSALGTTTLRDALAPKNSDFPHLHVLDNIDPTAIMDLEQKISLERTLFLVVTKSGGTPETLSLYSYFSAKIVENSLPTSAHFVFITDPEKGFLREQATLLSIPTFAVPENVGGRFSVLTAVGLLPAALIGISIRTLIAGARIMRDQFLSLDFAQNMPFQLASAQIGLYNEGFTNAVMMPYAQSLKTFSAWYAQLLAESTGKRDIDDEETGITPIAALGVTDQHSLLQQFTQGLFDKQFCVMRIKNFSLELKIPTLPATDQTKMLAGKTFNQLMNAECQATIDTLLEENRPVYSLEIDAINAQSLGAMFLLFEGATAFLGEFLAINAFDQPGVERSKILTRLYLTKTE